MKKNSLYCFWFGDQMSENRLNCYKSMIKNSNVNVIYVTPSNLYDFENEDHKFHPNFEKLTSNHKSDYLRAYFMYFYGGAYSDIKNIDFDWNPYFDLLEKSDKVAIGYREKSSDDINFTPAKLIFDQIIGTGAFIHKKGSILAKEWLDRAESKMDQDFSAYPLYYTELGGDIWHQVQVDNLGLWLFDLPYIDMNDYR